MQKSIPVCAALLMLLATHSAVQAKSSKLEAADKNAALDVPEYYGPTTAFDPEEAKAKLAEGDGTIRGFLYHTLNGAGRSGSMYIPGGPAQAVKGIKVYLYPATQHLIEWQKLFAKERGIKFEPPIVKVFQGRKRPRILKFDPRMQDYQLIATTDDYGRFTFDKMLPGTYYITAAADITGSYDGNEVVGHSTAYDAYGIPNSVEHTRPTTHSYSTPVFMDDFVTMKEGENKVELDAKMKVNRQAQ